MKGGHNRKPTRQKRLAGTYRRDRDTAKKQRQTRAVRAAVRTPSFNNLGAISYHFSMPSRPRRRVWSAHMATAVSFPPRSGVWLRPTSGLPASPTVTSHIPPALRGTAATQ
jgi:hypothetical protein